MEANIVETGHNDPFLNEQLSNRKRENPLDVLPVEICFNIFSKLPKDLEACSLVSKQWNALANDKALLNLWKGIPANAFGAKQWKEYFGVTIDPVNVPLLPMNIHKILKSQCPFSKKKKKVEDTHVLVLIPGNLNGGPLTLKTFGEFVKLKFPEFGKKGYRFLSNAAEKCDGTGKSYWVLMTKKNLTDSYGKSFAVNKGQVEERGQGIYQVPEALDVIVCAISEYARSNKEIRLFSKDTRLFSKYQLTYTLCQAIEGSGHLYVGGFMLDGLRVSDSNSDDRHRGVAALRKFF